MRTEEIKILHETRWVTVEKTIFGPGTVKHHEVWEETQLGGQDNVRYRHYRNGQIIGSGLYSINDPIIQALREKAKA